ncbi:MAG: prepilin peptidase [Gammaproteobacteria bacterium]|uniref:Prepilin leader peptidase/N-methyltransferase n=1 Tax=OM182 bacterium TaxID=2510334 RepID=A0A520S4U2_9GAMM|nr:prepilin peptidase [Gammaproteobacteria bacterium]OUV67525.1 MAG: hypothetical protein CBC93_04430 [Gammaproteobacteria bacterium TMED133]RZO77498.1 MAG: prepilin peptidase [OM182 bacterium]
MIEDLSLFHAQHPIIVTSAALILGLCIGSFLNVVILRLPLILRRQWVAEAHRILNLELSSENNYVTLTRPYSHCPTCKQGILPWHNIPILSYVMLNGKCASCGVKISSRYPVVELITSLLTAFTINAFGITYSGLFGCLFTWALITLSFIDHDTNLLPDDITLPSLWLGLFANFFELFVDFRSAFIGAILGYVFLWFIHHTYKLVMRKEGIGYGDFKLLALIGAWLGWQPLFLIVFLASIVGLIFTISRVLLSRNQIRSIAFGPYLASAGWVMMIWGDVIMDWYLMLIGLR